MFLVFRKLVALDATAICCLYIQVWCARGVAVVDMTRDVRRSTSPLVKLQLDEFRMKKKEAAIQNQKDYKKIYNERVRLKHEKERREKAECGNDE